MIADGGSFSDGEQHLLPVLSNKADLVETVAMLFAEKKHVLSRSISYSIITANRLPTVV